MPTQRGPLRPDFNRSPSLLTGMGSRPETRGKTADELNATLPVFSSWEEAAASPAFAGMDDRTRTMWLQELYGLGQDRAVQNGRIVNTNHSLRNGILGGIGMIGGLSAVGALAGGGAGAAGAGTLGGISTGAVAPTMTPISAALGGAAVPGATGAVVGAGTGAGMGAASWIGRGIDAGANIYGANRASAASNRAASASERAATAELAFLREQEIERRRQWEADQAFQAQKWKAEEEERAFNRREAERRAALEQQTFASNEDERLYRRRMADEREARLVPYREASREALGRIGTILGSGQSQWRSPSNAGRGTLGAMVGR